MNDTGEEICRSLMEEDATTGRKRRELKQEKQRLTAFSERLALLVEQIRDGDNDQGQEFEPPYANDTDEEIRDVSDDDDDLMIVDVGS